MAETVVSMARSTLGGAISTATSAAAAEMSLLMGVRRDIWFIKDELKTMQAFLAAAEATENKDMLLKVWAEQVRDLSYNIEDCLGEFMVHVASQSLLRKLMKLKDRHRIAVQIRDLKSRVEEVSSRNARYNLITTKASNTIDEVKSNMEDIRKHSGSNIDEAELVGFTKPKNELIKMVDLNTEVGPANVICVVGMGGLGKTTLARKTYKSEEDIVKNFSCRAWITVSQSFSKIEMLKAMIKQFFGGASLEKCLHGVEGKTSQVEALSKYLTDELQDKRYFIVLDDLWNIHDWEWIKDFAFPSSNEKGSRIIVTTRDVGLAEHITAKDLVYHLKPLDSLDATNLLLRKSRKKQEDMEKDENLKKTVEQLVIKCGCLPLAILTVGGILATKKIAEWAQVYNQLPSELEVNPNLEAMRRIVTLSYNHLPSHLKSCFLYLSIFPEDFEIERRRLIERWVAEGFIRARTGVSIEDVAKDYFNELINRSMLQPSRVNIGGVVKSCRVHDIVRDVMISISRDENFVYVVGDKATSVVEETFWHVAYHGGKCKKIDMDWSHVRSLTMFGKRPLELSPSVCSPDLRMLRVLDLENELTQKDISNIGLLRHLKYVNFSHGISYIYKLPRSIGKLQGLRTLNIGWSHITELPAEISKLKNLHSIRCMTKCDYHFFNLYEPKKCLVRAFSLPMVNPRIHAKRVAELHMAWSSWWSRSLGVRVPKGIGNLKELQILEVVDVNRTSGKTIKELGELVQLRKLWVETNGATEQKCKVLCDAIQKLSSLRSLRVDSCDYSGQDIDGTVEWLLVVSSPPPLLRTLWLEGYLGEIPRWFGNLMHLAELTLMWCQLDEEEDNSMEILGALPSLMHLRLCPGSFIEEKLVFRKEAFINLKKLHIELRQLREVEFEDSTSPQLEMIDISGCELRSGIIGISHLPSLKEISLGKVAKLGLLQSEVDAHPNSPVLRLYKERRYHDLGDVVVQVEEATGESSCPHPGTAAAGESSRSHAVVTTNVRTSN